MGVLSARELRIGNKLQKNNGEIFTILRLDNTQDVLVEEQRGLLTLGYNLIGIPLTEGILLKCGFVEKHKWFYKENFILGYTTTDDNLQAEYKFAGVQGDWKMLDIKYLHQLQNLYFALTSKELEINL